MNPYIFAAAAVIGVIYASYCYFSSQSRNRNQRASSYVTREYPTERRRTTSSGDECPICIENVNTNMPDCVKLRCSHLLHVDCYSELTQRGLAICPLCRAKAEPV